MKRINVIFLVSIILIGLASCKKFKNPLPSDEIGINNLSIPSNFDFSTTKTVNLTISDQSSGIIYDVYTIASLTENEVIIDGEDTTIVVDDMNHLIASGITVNNEFTTLLSVPSYHQNLLIIRNENGSFSSGTVAIAPIINYNGEALKNSNISSYKATAVTNTIYGVTRDKEFISIDAVTGEVSTLPTLPVSSITCAVDGLNKRVYFANVEDPYELYYYDIEGESFHMVSNLLSNFPKMAYNYRDGLIYISTTNTNPKLYKIDPNTGTYLASYKIKGLEDENGGDLAFASDGEMYIIARDGVYSTVYSSKKIRATKISPDDMPSSLTSAAFDNQGKLWMFTKKSYSKVVLFDVDTQTWEYKNISSEILINDFGSLVEIVTDDSDGDGVPDNNDDYPYEPDLAFNNIYPGPDSWASLAFEDLWPGLGDYDFNDLVLHYRINQISNAQNLVKEIKATFYVKHIGATLDNGFAFELPIDASLVSSVSGFNLTQNYITLAGNNTEASQDNAVILVFDNADLNLDQTLEIEIELHNGIAPETLGARPYNPFLIKNGDRAYEIHLPDMAPTQLADLSILSTFHDNSIIANNRYYKTSNNLPWAININYEFVHPLEKKEIILGYLNFSAWAESGGSLFPDWYKDIEGYRDNTYISN